MQQDFDGSDLLRLDEDSELVQALVRDLDRADVLAAGVAAGTAVACGEGAEGGGFSGLG